VVSSGFLTGCDLDLTGSPSSGTSSSPPDPDTRVVAAARAELARLIAAVSTTHGNAALLASHHAQLAALGGTPPSGTTRHRPVSTARLRHEERRAADRFAHWAVTARSGDLARVLASVSAGIRMQPILQGGP
jgi:hypothetical protein